MFQPSKCPNKIAFHIQQYLINRYGIIVENTVSVDQLTRIGNRIMLFEYYDYPLVKRILLHAMVVVNFRYHTQMTYLVSGSGGKHFEKYLVQTVHDINKVSSGVVQVQYLKRNIYPVNKAGHH